MKARDPAVYDREIVFQQATETQGSTGFAPPSWTNIGTNPTVWAKVTEKGGREFFKADKVNAETVTIFLIRYRSDITNKMRIVYNSRNYDIIDAHEIRRQEELEIIATAEVT